MLALQNQRYEVLATSSNEFLYEYVVYKDQLILADSTKTLFNRNNFYISQGDIGFCRNNILNLECLIRGKPLPFDYHGDAGIVNNRNNLFKILCL